MTELKRKKIEEKKKIETKAMNEADLPDIYALFCHYNQLYFNNVLGACTVDWGSKRMTLCAGNCQYMKTGWCAIRLSEPLLKFHSIADLKNTLLHEMIHAYLWLTDKNKDHDDHGPSFQKVMMEINSSTLPDHQRPACGYALSIYHNFTDEATDNYKTHHWRCKICGDLIKRAMNRQPSSSDCMTRVIRNEVCNNSRCHWHQHQKNCSGEYIKIAEPAEYQEKRIMKICGKRDNDGQMKNGNLLKKLNKNSLVTDHIKEESITGPSSQGTRSLEFFYPKLEKVNLSSDQKVSEEYSDEILTFKRRKQNPKENVKAGPSSTVMPKVERKRKKSEHEFFYPKLEKKVNLSSNENHVLDQNVSEEYNDEIPIFKRRKRNPKENAILTTEAKSKICKKVERKHKKSLHTVTSGTCGIYFDVIIKWKGWYAFEREDDDEVLEPLINKRSERRRHEKMLTSVEIQNGCDTQVSVEATGCKKSYNADISIFQTGRNNTTENHTQRSLIKRGNPGLDSSRTTGMVGRGTCLTGVTGNLECNHLCIAGSSPFSLPSPDNNRTETRLKRSKVVDKKEMLNEDMDLDLKGRLSDEGVNKKGTRRLLYLNRQSKKEQNESRQRHVSKMGNDGISVACPVCNIVFEGDIGEGDFNQRFNAHLDCCIGSCA